MTPEEDVEMNQTTQISREDRQKTEISENDAQIA